MKYIPAYMDKSLLPAELTHEVDRFNTAMAAEGMPLAAAYGARSGWRYSTTDSFVPEALFLHIDNLNVMHPLRRISREFSVNVTGLVVRESLRWMLNEFRATGATSRAHDGL